MSKPRRYVRAITCGAQETCSAEGARCPVLTEIDVAVLTGTAKNEAVGNFAPRFSQPQHLLCCGSDLSQLGDTLSVS